MSTQNSEGREMPMGDTELAVDLTTGGKTFLGHPSGLWVIFVLEMWERFSYYGMRALLTLYLIAKTGGDNPGFGWSEGDAYKLYGWYTGLVYLTPLAGGWLADRFLGTHRSTVIGGWIIAAGHICLAMTELFGHGAAEVITLQTAPGPLICFVSGLALIVIGTGFFKPCTSAMVGQLYSKGDRRRDAGFTIFYWSVNLGAFLATLIAGTLGEKVGWHWGFGSAAVGMILGQFAYQALRPAFLGNVGLPPPRQKERKEQLPQTPEERAQAERMQHELTRPLTRVDWDRITVILILAVFGIAFWVGFEQAGTSLNVFAAEETDRTVLGYQFPATWYQSANPLFLILLLAPLFAWLWTALEKRGLQPPTPVKYALGIGLMSLGYLVMVPGALEAEGPGLAGPHWLLLLYFLHTAGEVCLSPVGLSMVSRLSPVRLTSRMMGLYYGSFFISNLAAGYVAASWKQIADSGVLSIFGGQVDFFLVLFAVPFAVSLLVLALSPVIKRMMHGLH
ncbi:MAG TPA: peptide MFS transporter [Haliangium sp.]|nr:peptide MFS transporter [Haliangium sp.]